MFGSCMPALLALLRLQSAVALVLDTNLLPLISTNNSYHCSMEEALPLDTNYISIRALVDGEEQAKSGYGFITLVFDKATEALERCNVENPTFFLTFDALNMDTTRLSYNCAIFRWFFDNSTIPPTRIFNLVGSTGTPETPFASSTINLKYMRRQEIRFHHDSIEMDNKVSSLKSPECNFVPTVDDKTLFQLFIEFYVPQPIVGCGLQLLIPTGFVRTDEKFVNNNNRTIPIGPASTGWGGLNEKVVVNVSQSVFGGASGPENNGCVEKSAWTISLLPTLAFFVWAMCL